MAGATKNDGSYLTTGDASKRVSLPKLSSHRNASSYLRHAGADRTAEERDVHAVPGARPDAARVRRRRRGGRFLWARDGHLLDAR